MESSLTYKSKCKRYILFPLSLPCKTLYSMIAVQMCKQTRVLCSHAFAERDRERERERNGGRKGKKNKKEKGEREKRSLSRFAMLLLTAVASSARRNGDALRLRPFTTSPYFLRDSCC